MTRSKNNAVKKTTHQAAPAARRRRAAPFALALASVAGLIGPAAAQYNSAPPAGTAAPYSWPAYHSGAVTASPTGGLGPETGNPLAPPGIPPVSTTTPGGLPYFPLPGYYQLDGTPSGVEQFGNGAAATYPYVQIYSDVLGNWNPGAPPGQGGLINSGGQYFVPDITNHFGEGATTASFPPSATGTNASTISGPFFWQNNAVPSPDDVEGSPVAINASDFPEIASMVYTGTTSNQSGVPAGIIGTPVGAAAPVIAGASAIRQVVYFTRDETLPVIKDPTSGILTLGGVPLTNFDSTSSPQPAASISEGALINVAAVYCMDGQTGGIIWRYQIPSFQYTSAPSITSAGITANTSGAVSSATGNGPQPFEIGTAPTGEAITGVNDTGAAGTVAITSPTAQPYAGLDAANLSFSLQATTAVNNNDGTASYAGTFQIYNTGSNANSALASGTFTATATFTSPLNANVTGVFTVTGGSAATTISPLLFNGTFTSTAPGTGQSLQGTLQSAVGGTTVLQGAKMLNSVTVARIPVNAPYTNVGGAVTGAQTRLVVIAADNNGYVYCLDALGNDYWNADPGTSNTNLLYHASGSAANNGDNGDATIDGQVDYDVLSDQAGYRHDVWADSANNPYKVNANPHVATTFPYWVYRPDPSQPLQGPSGSKPGTADSSPAADHTLPVPQAFNHASPVVFAPTANTNGTFSPATASTVYIGNSNGVLYALDGQGGTPGANATTPGTASSVSNQFNVALSNLPGIFTDTPTTKVDWWDSLSGADADQTDSGGTALSNVSIQSTPAIYYPSNATAGQDPTVYITTCSSNNQAPAGRVYAIDAATGPTGNNGSGSAMPGSADYNVNPVGLWLFPKTTTLGDIYGSPVVFINPHDPTNTPYVYFGANCGAETRVTSTTGTQTSFPATDDNGRIWSVNATTGQFSWVYPSTTSGTGGNPDTSGTVYSAPLTSGFEYATPAMGLVQWPLNIEYSTVNATTGAVTGTAYYTHTDNYQNFTEDGAAGSNLTPGQGPVVPMLYIGTNTNSSTGDGGSLYYVDVDGINDTQRFIYALGADTVSGGTGTGFQSSPVLVVNPSTQGGNGGVLFFTLGPDTAGEQSYLDEVQATPTSTGGDTGAATPAIDYAGVLSGGPVSSPAVASYNISDLTTGTTVTATQAQQTATDWVYIGDLNSGQCYGYTPASSGPGSENYGLSGIIPAPNSQYQSAPALAPFPLRSYVYDATTANGVTHNPKSTAITDANPYGTSQSSLPIFEWGQNAYIRIANVVPPGAPNAADPTSYVMTQYTYTDQTGTHNYYLGNGSAINIYTAQVDNSGNVTATGVAPITIPAQKIPVNGQNVVDPTSLNGFFERTDAGTPDNGNPSATGWGQSSELTGATGTAYRAPQTVLLDGNGKGIAASATYSVGFQSALDPNGASPARRNTPGSRRELSNVTQTATIYQATGFDQNNNPTGFQAATGTSAVTLTLTANPAFSYPTTVTTTTNGQQTQVAATGNLYIDQPTFGILNPLAVRAAGVNLTPSTAANPNGHPVRDAAWRDTQGNEGAGPFRGVAGTQTLVDLEALANGNFCYTQAPPSGQLAINLIGGGNGSGGGIQLQNNATTLQPYYRYVITTTPQVPDGADGDNSNPAQNDALPTGTNLPNLGSSGSNVDGLPTGSNYGQYMLDIADRSMLGLDGPNALNLAIQPSQLFITMQRQALAWQDNTPLAALGGILPTGAYSRINPLVWDDVPTVGDNTSRDYPNIPAADIIYSLSGSNSISNTGLTGAALNGTPANRYVTPQSAQVAVDVPKYQPANLQLWQGIPASNAYSAISPDNPTTGATTYSGQNENFPMGYAARVRISGAAAVNGAAPAINPQDRTQPYREAYVYTGVPVDIKTSIASPTTDIGTVPQGFGVQANALKANVVNNLLTYNPTGATTVGAFTPYTSWDGYLGHFQPLDIISQSNVNLINPHLDQVVGAVVSGAAQPLLPPSLTLLSDALDSSFSAPYSYIPAYDLLGETGPRTGSFNGVAEQPFLVRSSLDTDLSQAYGKNPVFSTLYANEAGDYPGVTVHKPRVGDGTGSTVRVPDVPHDNIGLAALPTATTPAVIANGVPSGYNSATQAYFPESTLPFVSVAVPLGTPVGTYAQNLRMFEGYDVSHYDPLVGPLYATGPNSDVGGGYGTFSPDATLQSGYLQDVFQLAYSTNSVPTALQPYSDPATQLRVEVGEARLGNGFTDGALPMVDTGLSGPTPNGKTELPSVNFAPFAFRDPASGALSLYWTTLRTYLPGNGSPLYSIIGANLGFMGNFKNSATSYGYFTPSSATSKQTWWGPINNLAPASGNTQATPPGNNVGWATAINFAPYNAGTGYAPDPTATLAYGFNINIGTTAPYASSIYCYAVTPSTGQPSSRIIVASSPQPKSDVHGLKFTLSNGFADPNGGSAIPNDLWTFWTGGTRGNTALYYSSVQSSQLANFNSVNGSTPFTGASVLPIPAGITAVSAPNPALSNVPNPQSSTGTPTQAIEVTYNGLGPAGNSDLYLSRYQPYHPITNGAVNNNVTLLGLMPFPSIIEQLQPESTGRSASTGVNVRVNWWDARDVGWVRNAADVTGNDLQVQATVTSSGTQYRTTVTETSLNTYQGVYATAPLNSATFTQQGPTFTGQIVYDRASGILVFSNVTLPQANGTGVMPATGQSVYVDVAGGRVRFSVPMPVPISGQNNSAYSSIQANFQPTARRITSSVGQSAPATSNTQPVALLDEAFEPNLSGVSTDPNIQADRYWFFYRQGNTLFNKTQRLTVALVSSNTPTLGQPISINPATLKVSLTASGTALYAPNGGAANKIDVDPARGRLYFPITLNSANNTGGNSLTALEGQTVTVSATGVDSAGQQVNISQNYVIYWQDEPRYNDVSSQQASGGNSATTYAATPGTATGGYQVPMATTINESGISAFIDPLAYQNTSTNTPSPTYQPGLGASASNEPVLPHNIWLFWTSTRNGSSDLYYETMNPRFAAVAASGSP